LVELNQQTGRINLQDPIDRRYVQSPSSYVCANQGALLCIAKLEERVGPLLLLLLAVQRENRHVDVV
jgi:hypothetical protein